MQLRCRVVFEMRLARNLVNVYTKPCKRLLKVQCERLHQHGGTLFSVTIILESAQGWIAQPAAGGGGRPGQTPGPGQTNGHA